MNVWDLEKQYGAFIDSVVGGRERKRRDIRSAVEGIRNEVIKDGEAALVRFSLKWDRWERELPLKLTEKEIAAGASRVSRGDLTVLRGMIRNVRLYHRGQKGKKRAYARAGLTVREEFVPVERALVYVPGGTAGYPSSLVMGVVPAQIAGVKDVVVATPATGGQVNPHTCAAAYLLGIKEVYRIGGAQAIYAFSYGVGKIPRVDMIVGPGNAFVEEAKRDVYGRVGIDMLAGPTELMILCTEPFAPEAVAWDIFSQAEHDEMAMVGLLSPSKRHLEEVRKAMGRLLERNPRRAIIEKALEANGFMAHYRKPDTAVKAVNDVAPEHMELVGDETLARKILYPGIIYVGPHTTVAMGDYYIGTNHVLPTAGAGRFSGGLSVDRFMKRRVEVKLAKSFLDRYGEKAIRLSQIEGLYAHGEAIRVRKER